MPEQQTTWQPQAAVATPTIRVALTLEAATDADRSSIDEAVAELTQRVRAAAKAAIENDAGTEATRRRLPELAALVKQRNDAAARVHALPLEIEKASRAPETTLEKLVELQNELGVSEVRRSMARKLLAGSFQQVEAFKGEAEAVARNGACAVLFVTRKRLEEERAALNTELVAAVAPLLERAAALQALWTAAVENFQAVSNAAALAAVAAVVPPLPEEPPAPRPPDPEPDPQFNTKGTRPRPIHDNPLVMGDMRR